MSDESVAHALEGWRQAERDEKATHEDGDGAQSSTPEQREENEERVVEARNAYEAAAERAHKRQEPDPEDLSVANLDQPAADTQP